MHVGLLLRVDGDWPAPVEDVGVLGVLGRPGPLRRARDEEEKKREAHHRRHDLWLRLRKAGAAEYGREVLKWRVQR